MRATAMGAVSLALIAGVLVVPVSAHERDLMTIGGRVGPINTGATTIGEMKEIFGDINDRDVIRVGCSRVVRLRWGGIETLNYKGTDEIVDVRVRTERVPSKEGTFRFHTRRDLRVGHPEARLRKLYPDREGITHSGHTHYILGERGTRLLAKVVEGIVVELESAPYEFC